MTIDTASDSQALTKSHTSSEQDLLTWVRGVRKDYKSSSFSELLSPPIHYSPGTLPMSQLSTFQHCYTDPSIYSNQLSGGGSKRRAPISEKHKLALVLLPKSGSSTGRFMMKVSSHSEFHACHYYISLLFLIYNFNVKHEFDADER